MILLIYGNHFLKSAKKLPKNIQEKLKIQLDALSQNTFYPLPHTKPLAHQLVGLYSFRITRD
ncbi:MAG: hypothetical protein A3F95_01185 [Candidatus Nealsonbacteria bacterium RIFCSPLOWO2_12_FULL_39_31]|uniref:Uncharacterized protein n=2 Tax=Candidatus Nealsoniibacteriota TaxID=1817911 RepID=A0A1G2EJX0_9BACT|nr:MAG: hypothetical protein US88_C0008G0032 [Parcubacteria group bacterium GW2011_GWA2_38_27]KKQ96836.1 MAG: hypothetical protein UT22_C0023G0006 [Parcubacteria group bacterium GW2011_GWC2_39_11]OGZ19329.1 MAG: hypothetical protein A2626_00970 [Candidatus Nealsonbacteria bacterium RIFCSPHIGHO2_01_FULL_38_55]OGZ22125.1 MAG: hypothetical protein A2W55_00275 [Candidatus Nealsonbacteria bacterium RIFCSPHIGHO2_02_38_10]OGZ22235.1 MAG: hypothetical protein A3C48_01600 [Candidatus Nealsonbacteria bac